MVLFFKGIYDAAENYQVYNKELDEHMVEEGDKQAETRNAKAKDIFFNTDKE